MDILCIYIYTYEIIAMSTTWMYWSRLYIACSWHRILDSNLTAYSEIRHVKVQFSQFCRDNGNDLTSILMSGFGRIFMPKYRQRVAIQTLTL